VLDPIWRDFSEKIMTNCQQELSVFSEKFRKMEQSKPIKFVYLLVVVKVFVPMKIPM